ncbi:MAG TPA: hypothetical protein VG936_09055 [Lacunisphaera sp.]|nr:hypothetical protein [Lacunisphaera sp.]
MKSYHLSRRGLVPSAPAARERLQQAGGRFVEEYECHDVILLSADSSSGANGDSIRIRSYPRGSGKPWVVTQKTARFEHGVKADHLVFSFECRTESDLQHKLAEFERTGYQRGYAFSRTGWQYDFTDAAAFVELVEFLEPSVEICAGTEAALSQIASKIGLDRFIGCSLAEYVKQVLVQSGPRPSTSVAGD